MKKCSKCGSSNIDFAKLCFKCNARLNDSPSPGPSQNIPISQTQLYGDKPKIIEKFSKGYKLSSSGAALAILCFFLPWMLGSCGGQTVTLSGWEMAAGTRVGQGFFVQQMEGTPILFLILLAAFCVIYLAYTAYNRGSLIPIMDGYGPIALGVIPLLILLITFSGVKEQAAQQGIYVEFQFGLWGSVLGYLAAIAGGVLNLRE